MLVVGKPAQDRRCAEEWQAVTGQLQRSEHFTMFEATPIEQRDDEVDLRSSLDVGKAVCRNNVETGALQGRPELMVIDRMIAVGRVGPALLAGMLGQEHDSESRLFGRRQGRAIGVPQMHPRLVRWRRQQFCDCRI